MNTFKTAIAGLVLVASWAAIDARAADLPVKAAPVPPLYLDYWAGFYAGGHAGIGVDRGAGTATDPFGSMGFNTSPAGFVGGVHAGYNFHTPGSAIVFGVEADGDVATLDGTLSNPGFIGSIGAQNRWLASVRGRLGFLLAPTVMAYGTGGWGWAGEKFVVTGTDGSQFSATPTLSGAVLGGGLEHALTPNWGVRVEYLHYFLQDLNANTTGSINGGPILPIGANVTHSLDVARAGLSYKF